jgi:hypothetical protein
MASKRASLSLPEVTEPEPEPEINLQDARDTILSEFMNGNDFSPLLCDLIQKREMDHMRIKTQIPDDAEVPNDKSTREALDSVMKMDPIENESNINKILNDAIIRCILPRVSQGSYGLANHPTSYQCVNMSKPSTPTVDISSAKNLVDVFISFAKFVTQQQKQVPEYVEITVNMPNTGIYSKQVENICFLLLYVISFWKSKKIKVYTKRLSNTLKGNLSPLGEKFYTNMTDFFETNMIYKRIISKTTADSLITNLMEKRRRFDREEIMFAGDPVLSQISFYSRLLRQNEFKNARYTGILVPFFDSNEAFTSYLVHIVEVSIGEKINRTGSDVKLQLFGSLSASKEVYVLPCYTARMFGAANLTHREPMIGTAIKNDPSSTYDRGSGTSVLILVGWSKEIDVYTKAHKLVKKEVIISFAGRPQTTTEMEMLLDKFKQLFRNTNTKDVELELLWLENDKPVMTAEMCRFFYTGITKFLREKGITAKGGQETNRWLDHNAEVLLPEDTKEVEFERDAYTNYKKKRNSINEKYELVEKANRLSVWTPFETMYLVPIFVPTLEFNIIVSHARKLAEYNDSVLIVPFDQVCEISRLPRVYTSLYRLIVERKFYGKGKVLLYPKVRDVISPPESGYIEVINRIE